MCQSPLKITEQGGLLVACRKCWQCKENAINDWVGRCIAESHTATQTRFVTLTYGRDDEGNENHIRAAVLTYSDVQKYFKKLRKNYSFSYFVVGEYGALKGRAHWHVLLFFRGNAPNVKMNKRIHEENWKHGLSQWEHATHPAVRYMCKYIRKEQAEGQFKMEMSKKPPLGSAYFKRLAKQYVDQGIAPQSPEYQIDGHKYWIKDKSKEIFLDAFEAAWIEKHPNRHPPVSEWFEEYLDKKVPEDIELKFENKKHHSRVPVPEITDYPLGVTKAEFSEAHNSYWCLCPLHKEKLYWRRTEEGYLEWHAEKNRPHQKQAGQRRGANPPGRKRA